MKIALLSTRHGRGLTTLSTLLADMCSRRYSMPCMLAHTGVSDISMSRYLGLGKYDDKTRSIRQIVKLLEVNEISGDDLKNYTIKKGRLGIFDTYSEDLEDSLGTELLNLVLTENRNSLSFIDVAGDITDENIIKVIKDSDYYIFVLSQSKDVLEQFNAWKECELWKTIESSGYLAIVNCFNKNIGAIDNISKVTGIRKSKILKFSYNPLITKYSNDGNLLGINDLMDDKDVRVTVSRNDMNDCLKVIAANLGIPYKME